MEQDRIVFGCAVSGAASQAQACLLVESIRENAGRFAHDAIWICVPRGGDKPTEKTAEALDRLGAHWIEFEIDSSWQSIPFAGKVAASAMAELMAARQGQQLVWLDPDTIFFQEPHEMLLQPGKALGCRPVDHKLIGSPVAEPLDGFWREVYRVCDVPEARQFTMFTSADEIPIRPYINAGCLVVRPEIGLLQAWRERFGQALAAAVFEPYFQQHVLYLIFLHQAILVGAVLAALREAQIQILPHLINYPMHMHDQYPAARRPARMNELISGRYDTFFDDPGWPTLIPCDKPLRGWLAARVAAYGLAAGR